MLGTFFNSNNSNRTSDVFVAYGSDIIFLVFNFPFIFCNLYYAFTDQSCVHNSAKPLNLNLEIYLIVSAILLLVELLVYTRFLILMSYIDKRIMFYIPIISCCTLFELSWDISGAVIFWKYVDTSTCSESIYSYIFALLIIRLIFQGYFILKEMLRDNKRSTFELNISLL